jgi:cytochrome c biogenesis protein CcmG/thiol:disulfide interchange protein DsbE
MKRSIVASMAVAGLALAACTTASGDVAGDRVTSVAPSEMSMNTTSPRDPALLPLVIAADLPDCPDSDPSLAPIEPVGALGGGLPDLTLACLGEGPDVTLSGLRGTPMVINVWASWCPPCIIEMPLLADAARTYADDLLMLGIDMQDRSAAALDIAATLDLGFASVVDQPGRVRAALTVPGPPVTFFVTADGVIAGRHDGRIPDDETLDELINDYLGIPRP